MGKEKHEMYNHGQPGKAKKCKIVRRNTAVMVAARKASLPAPPPRKVEPIINGTPHLRHWFMHYWQKLQLPTQELSRLAITQDRREFMRWTGKRIHIMVLGCYCYLPAPAAARARSSKKKAV